MTITKQRVKYNNITAIPLSNFIESFLEDMKMSVEELAEQSKIDIQTLKQFLNSEIDINEEIANKLSTVTGIYPDMLMDLQESYYDDLQKINILKAKETQKNHQ